MELKDISKERASEKDIILKHYFSTREVIPTAVFLALIKMEDATHRYN